MDLTLRTRREGWQRYPNGLCLCQFTESRSRCYIHEQLRMTKTRTSQCGCVKNTGMTPTTLTRFFPYSTNCAGQRVYPSETCCFNEPQRFTQFEPTYRKLTADHILENVPFWKADFVQGIRALCIGLKKTHQTIVCTARSDEGSVTSAFASQSRGITCATKDFLKKVNLGLLHAYSP